MDWLSIYFYLVSIFIVVYLFFKWKFSYWKNSRVPYLEPSIPYGNMRNVNKSKHMKDLIEEIYYKFKHETPVAGMYFLFSPIAVILDLDLIKTVLIKEFTVFQDKRFYHNEKDDPLTAHIFNLDGDKWKTVRQKLTPTFTSGKMKYMFPTVVDVCNRFTDRLHDELKQNPEIEMKEILARFTTDVIGRCAFGIECNSLNDPNAEFRNYGRAAFAQPRHGRFWNGVIRQFPEVARKLHVKVLRDDITNFFLKIVQETVTYREENNIRQNDFMDLLIELKNGKDAMSIEEIAAQAFVFFLAGFETSSTTMSYALYELGLHQDIQEKAREEIRSVLEKHNGQLTYESMMEMRYVDQIVSETLRKYPPGIAIVRCANQDYKLPNSNIVIEEGTKILIPAYSIHHDPDIYPHPEEFDPSRFEPEEEKKRHPMSFLAFGEGPRICIGLRFGRMQSRIGLINLLRNFRVKHSSRMKVPLEFDNQALVLTSKGGMFLKLEKIE